MTATAIDKYTLRDLPAPKVITSEAQHKQYVSALLDLERRKRLTSEERSYAELLTVLIDSYEEERYPIRAASPVEVLQELVSANDLRQKDLAPLLGTESIVSEVLSGKRPLTRRHIEKLSARFNVSPAVFF
jgi:HTH-type transcriptional regulator/antitoxin HigA